MSQAVGRVTTDSPAHEGRRRRRDSVSQALAGGAGAGDGVEPLAAALQFTARGFCVFPCHPATKQPLVKSSVAGQGGHKLATTDTAEISGWWRRYPKAMIGLPTGLNIGAFVVDIDAGVDDATGEIFSAEQILSDLECELGCPLPATVSCTTPRGGLHLYFAVPAGEQMPGNKAGVIPRVDIRGTGGYVVAPPSRRSDGKSYAWLTSLLMQAPTIAPVALLDLIRHPKRLDNPSKNRRTPARSNGGGTAYGLAALDDETSALRRAPAGTRNDSLFHAAICLGQLVASEELELSVVEAALITAAKAWPNLTKSRGTIRSGLSRGLKEPREPRRISNKRSRPDVGQALIPANLDRKLAEFDMTDLGNARRFQARYSDHLLHSQLTGWYQFDGQRWTTEGADAAVQRAAQDTVDALKREAEALEDDPNNEGD
jgi:putative DNA primase/helicase